MTERDLRKTSLERGFVFCGGWRAGSNLMFLSIVLLCPIHTLSRIEYSRAISTWALPVNHGDAAPVEAIVKWINHLANLTLKIEILINLCVKALFFAAQGDGDEVGWRHGKSVSFHVTFAFTCSYVRLERGTVVPWDFVSTHTQDEGVGWRDRFFISMSVGLSKSMNGWLCFGEEEEILFLDNIGSDVGIEVITWSSE